MRASALSVRESFFSPLLRSCPSGILSIRGAIKSRLVLCSSWSLAALELKHVCLNSSLIKPTNSRSLNERLLKADKTESER